MSQQQKPHTQMLWAFSVRVEKTGKVERRKSTHMQQVCEVRRFLSPHTNLTQTELSGISFQRLLRTAKKKKKKKERAEAECVLLTQCQERVLPGKSLYCYTLKQELTEGKPHICLCACVCVWTVKALFKHKTTPKTANFKTYPSTKRPVDSIF